MTLLSSLGLDDDEFTWKDLGYCITPREFSADDVRKRADQWFDEYEDNPVLAEQIDEICMACPVAKQCLRDGINNHEWGVWGGVYLENGRIKRPPNSHKTPATWKELEKIHGKLKH